MKPGTIKRIEKAETHIDANNEAMIKATFSDGREEVIHFMDGVLYGYGMISLADILKDADVSDADIIAVELLNEGDIPYVNTLLQAIGIDVYRFKGEVYEAKRNKES